MASLFTARRKPKRIVRDEPPDTQVDDVEEEDSGPVVRRPTTNAPKTKSKLRVSFNPGEETTTANEGDGQTEREAASQPRSQQAHPSRTSRLGPSSAAQSLLNRGGGATEGQDHDRDRDGDRPTYTKSYLEELRNSTPSTPRDLTTSLSQDRSPASSSLELLAHESGDGNGSLALDLESKFGKSALSSGSSRIPTAAEIREKKERRARLAKEQAANAHNNNEDDFIPLEDYDSDGEFKPRRMQVGSYIPHQTEKDTRLVRDDEDFAEGFDEFVEDTGRVSLLSRKAQREQALKGREAIRSMINEAEGGDSLSDGSGGDGSGDDESDTEYERHQLYESAQTHRAMDGLPAHAEHTRQINRPRQPRHTTPLPKLSVGLARLRDMVSSLEFERARIQKRRADILREKAEIKASQEHIQTSLEEAGRELERVTKEHLEKAKTAAANGTTTAVPSAAGNGNGNGNTTPNININAGSGSGHNGNGQSLLQSQSTAATMERGLESFGNTPGNTA
ncbi:hypothetical protein HRR83_001742 [Exophiala dermatitidis]|uniref:Uncharacterized protein n=2 Tax=Exophiala dermatitidis TaxID=5970 RepID=H6C5E7_EXODN|nr:uncharacterized protein HMPREF1120_06994 [Exophiala dermatitidis NIH/UT8656]KAJ4516412.1 hypothetical protein HRR73_004876 [Exophiala dermatitidis]EHY58994.1 hypothetical protein HMPREF1120_06994 [Exophiala dermatitidis NIH/UT8656]KAJ4523210.1 hypothetical protein HRR75_001610 [Exophiala dermatitidis]KAJ4526547.1 hypothetical protein HRR74_001746 [Exophiala dermatitidis]KAJ4532206.1 hypothetical protein HRR76_007204 [Exophiala dermatitidis]